MCFDECCPYPSDYEYTKIASSAIIHKIYDFHGMHDSSSLYKDFYIDNTSSFITDNDEIVSLLSLFNWFDDKNNSNGNDRFIISFSIIFPINKDDVLVFDNLNNKNQIIIDNCNNKKMLDLGQYFELEDYNDNDIIEDIIKYNW